MNEPTRRWCRCLGVLLLLSVGFAALFSPAQAAQPRVRTKSGETAKPVIAVDNVCAWPNLTRLNDGSIIATIFNQPSHGSMAGDVDCWATTDGGYPSSVQLPDGQVLTAYYARAIADHDRYHLSVATWDPSRLARALR